MKSRNSPFFPQTLRELAHALGLYWRELSAIVDLKGTVNENNTWTKAQRGDHVSLTSSSNSIALDLERSNCFKHTLTENTTLANPTHIVVGQSGVIVFTQHASSPKTIDFGTYWVFEGGAEPELTATNSAVDVLVYEVLTTTTILAAMLNDVK